MSHFESRPDRGFSVLPGGTHPLKHLDLPMTTLHLTKIPAWFWVFVCGVGVASALLPFLLKIQCTCLRFFLTILWKSAWAVGEKYVGRAESCEACPAAVDGALPAAGVRPTSPMQGAGQLAEKPPSTSSQLFESREGGGRGTYTCHNLRPRSFNR